MPAPGLGLLARGRECVSQGHAGGETQAELMALDWAVVAVVLLYERIRLGQGEGADLQLAHAATACCGVGRSRRFHGSFARAYAAIVFGLTLLPHMWTCWDRVNRCPLWPRSMM
ncbi:hypothetical protein Q067_02387 [Pseudomonas aeruginosa BL13]|nr:hypothetical protein Q067_02387 [Pseudomonas aeruginosa BL13]